MGNVQRPKILIVDDRQENLYTLQKLLAVLDVDVISASSGFSAMELAVSHDFCLAIVDVQMPEMDGYELVEFLRGNLNTRSLPVIFVSAIFSDEYHHRRGYDAGAVDFISKPFNPEILLSKVRIFLELYRQRLQLEDLVSRLDSVNLSLSQENLRMEAELHTARRLQTMLLPKDDELCESSSLDIASFVRPAHEVSGDYYDVIVSGDRYVFGVGDVTGHGLESGVLTLMMQTALRSLLCVSSWDPATIFSALNTILRVNMRRMGLDKMLTLALLVYEEGRVHLSGQHEDLIVVRASGHVERYDTTFLGMPLGLTDAVAEFIQTLSVDLQPGDGVVLYSDGITEAENPAGEFYGLDRLCAVISLHWGSTSEMIKDFVLADFDAFVAQKEILDDLLLLVIKRR